jgi:hypothetical protein
MGAFVANRRWFTMSRVNHSVVRKGKDLFADAPEQGGVVATGELCGPDTFMEKDVATDEKALFCAVEANATRGVARQEEDGEAVLAQQ